MILSLKWDSVFLFQVSMTVAMHHGGMQKQLPVPVSVQYRVCQIFGPCFRICQKFELLRFLATKVGVGGRGCKLVCMFKLSARHNGNMKNIVSMATRASKLTLLSK